MKQRLAAILAVLASLAASGEAEAANTPCSGKKGGVSHCLGSYFICKDGSTSQSKRICTANSGVSPDEEPTHNAGGKRKSRR